MFPGASLPPVLGVLLVCGLLAGRSRAGRAAAVTLAVLNLALPFVVPDLAGLHFVAALVAAWGVVRVSGLVRETPLRPPAARAFQAVTAFDTRTTEHGAPAFDARLLGVGLLYGALGTAAGLVVWHAPWRGATPAQVGVRWISGVVFAYAAGDTADRLARFAYALSGWRVAPVQEAPILSRTVAEFWGTRWNVIVSGWLRRDVFMPVARRTSARVGLVAAFAASALLHGYLMAPAGAAWMTLSFAAFFLVQAPVVLVERLLRVPRWPAPLAHAWVVSSMLVTSPLFVEPMMRVCFGR